MYPSIFMQKLKESDMIKMKKLNLNGIWIPLEILKDKNVFI